jgi:hypothetical protein
MPARLNAIVGMVRRQFQKSVCVSQASVVGSIATTVAERPSWSMRLISPAISPARRMARMTAVPSGRITCTLTVPSRTI